jgi:hypothetical protein
LENQPPDADEQAGKTQNKRSTKEESVFEGHKREQLESEQMVVQARGREGKRARELEWEREQEKQRECERQEREGEHQRQSGKDRDEREAPEPEEGRKNREAEKMLQELKDTCEVEEERREKGEAEPLDEELKNGTRGLEDSIMMQARRGREEQNREMQVVPAPELAKKWKASLKSRIDQEIETLIQVNRQWFEENASKAEENEKPYLQTELEIIARSLDVLRDFSLEMFSSGAAEMVILVERGSTEQREAVTTDAARGDGEEVGASETSRAPNEEPQALNPGRRGEEPPEVELAKAAEVQEAAVRINDSASVVTQLDKLKSVNTPRQKSKRSAVFSNARHFVIHHATFINSETATIATPTHGMWDSCSTVIIKVNQSLGALNSNERSNSCGAFRRRGDQLPAAIPYT